MAKDYYSILGVSKTASKDEIKQAYRKLSKELHPDKNKATQVAEAKYKEVNEAYEALSDDKKRQSYDQFGTADGPGGFGGAGGFNFNGFDFSGFQGQGQGGGFSDIFESFFGGQSNGRSSQKGRDIELELKIDFMDSVTGAHKKVSVTRLRECTGCHGSGAAEGSTVDSCTTCKGTGQVTRIVQSFLGTVQQSTMCTACRGSGKVPKEKCKACQGEGRKNISEEVTIDVPAGIHDGQSLRINGGGEAGRQKSGAGDLYVHITVKPHPQFKREQDDIHTSETISVLDAILGTQLEVQTVHGPMTLKIPEGTQPGQIFRLKGKGMPVLNTSRTGDHYTTVTVEVPASLSKKET